MKKGYKQFAISLAKRSGKIIRTNFRRGQPGMKRRWKNDDTPVTLTDLEINRLVIREVKKYFPAHGVLGEEQRSTNGAEEYIWVVDPLDGTVPFSHGYPTCAFSLALVKNGVSVLGVLYDPIMDRLLVGERGSGAFLNGKRIHVSPRKNMNNAMISLDGDYVTRGMRKHLLDQGAYITTFYSAAYASMLVALGEFVAEIYEYKYPWDGAAVKVIVEEAGGKVTDLFGKDQRYDKEIRGFVATNGVVHGRILALIRSSKK